MQSHSTHVLWFLAGVCTGAAIGLVLAPSPGSDTRRLMTQSGRDCVERGRELYDMGRQLADDAARMFDEGKRLMEGEWDVANSS